MGINSDVLNTKTANVRPIKGNQEVNEFFNCIIIKRVIVVLKQLCNEYKLIVFSSVAKGLYYHNEISV